ncbi:MAG: hypothetical protein K2P84_04205 [Undibacterium sp.]|nr:hypothetical protein [Undibacterium sp.]
MSNKPDTVQDDDELPVQVDFSKGVRGKFYHANTKLNLPVYLDEEVQAFLSALASKKGVEMSDIANDLLKKDIALLDVLR